MNQTETSLIQPFPEWSREVRAAFTTRHCGGASTGAHADLNLGFFCGDDPVRVADNWKKALAAGGLAGIPLVVPRMVHGDRMADAGDLEIPETRGVEPWADDGRLEVDALFTRKPGLTLAVTMADCLAMLLFDPSSGTVAAIHAGWRGTRLGILSNVLERLADEGAIRPQSTLLAFSPCLRSESLEVGAEVAAQLPGEFLAERAGRFFFDLPGCNRAQALARGIEPEHIRDAGGNTLGDPSLFFSYRRDGRVSGRMAAFIGLPVP